MSSLQNVSCLSFQTSTIMNSHSHTLANDSPERKTKALESGFKRSKGATHREQTESVSETSQANAIRRTSQHAIETARDRPSGQLFSTTSFTIQPISNCGQCEQDSATLKCVECGENYCAQCFTQFHTRGALQRHHYISLTEEYLSPKQTQPRTTDTNPPASSPRHNLNNAERRYIITAAKPKPNNIVAEKESSTSSRQELSHDDSNKPRRRSLGRNKVITTMHEPSMGQREASEKLPTVEFSASKTTANGKSVTKTFRLVDNNTQAVYIHRPKRLNVVQPPQPTVNTKAHQRHSFPNRTSLHPPRTDTERSQNNLSKARTTQGARAKPVKENANAPGEKHHEGQDEQQQPVTHPYTTSHSRPLSVLIKEDSFPAQSNSESLSHEPLQFKSDDESQPADTSPLVLSHPSSSTMNKSLPPATRSSVIAEYSIARFNLALDDIVDKTKLELANQMNRLSETTSSTKSEKDQSFTRLVPVDLVTKATGRDSPFSFSNSLGKTNRIHSASSVNAGDGAFFTDTLLRQVIQSPSPEEVVSKLSSSDEAGHESRNKPAVQQERSGVLSRQPSPRSSSRTSPSRSINLDETPQQSTLPSNDHSRQDSSLLSSSLHLVLTPSEFDPVHSNMEPLATSSRKNSSIAQRSALPLPRGTPSATIIRASSSVVKTERLSSSTGTTRVLSPPDEFRETPATQTTTITTERRRVLTPSENHPRPRDPLQPSNEHMSTPVNDVSEGCSKKSATRNETVAKNKLPSKKTMDDSRYTTASDDSSKFRKFEFSLNDGLKWQTGSTE